MDKPEFPFDNKYIEDVLNWTLPGCQLLYRDTDFPFDAASLYEKLTLFRAGFFIDCSAKAGKLMKKTRFILASAHSASLWKIMPEDEDMQAWKLHTLHFNSYFKVMDIYKVGDKTQILLLHIPYKALPLFAPNTEIQFNFEDALPLNLVEIARKSFDTKMQMDPIPELETEAWNERTFNLPGTCAEGIATLDYVDDTPEVASLSQLIRKLAEDEDSINRP